MKLIKFIIELSNHLLDVLSFFFLVELINDSLLDVFLCIAWDNGSVRSCDQLTSYLRRQWLLRKDQIDWCIFILLQHINVPVVNVINSLFINFIETTSWTHSKWCWSAINVHVLPLNINWVTLWLNHLTILANHWGHLLNWLWLVLPVVHFTLTIESINTSPCTSWDSLRNSNSSSWFCALL